MMKRLTFSLLTFALCGCRSVSTIRAPEMPTGNRGYLVGGSDVVAGRVLTAREAERARDEGVALSARQSRTAERMAVAALKLDAAAQVLTNDFGAQVATAQAWSFIAENETDTEKRRDAAKRGIVAARQARALQANRVEGHYWYAVNVGFLADVDRSYGLNAVAEMEPSLKRAGEIDERYDYAGPLRVLGVLLLRTPPPPVSIGSPRKGLRLLQQAVERFPDYPENYLYFGEALRENGHTEEAREAWQKALLLPIPADRQSEAGRWRDEMKKMLAQPAK